MARIDPAGLPFVAGALAAGAIAGAALSWGVAVACFVAGGFFLFFFRDPDRRVSAGRNDVVAPADGRVLVAGRAENCAMPTGAWQQISVFLSPIDVHVNRVPVSGRVMRVSFTKGRFLPAYRRDAGKENERSEIWIDHEGQVVVVRQIVGILARRVVCRLQAGADVQTGERFGIMKFGSRMDVFLPQDADITVKVGESVRGGETVIAVLH
jgi:phosphatidylserine decarboxylase